MLKFALPLTLAELLEVYLKGRREGQNLLHKRLNRLAIRRLERGRVADPGSLAAVPYQPCVPEIGQVARYE
jgi:hypothetical protein